jgi:hypothetical protein
MKLMRVGLIAIALVGALASPTAALATHSVGLTLTDAVLVDSTTIRLSGTINCTRGSFVGTWNVSASADQNPEPRRHGEGLDGAQCSFNSVEPWTIEVVGGPFHPGPAMVSVTGTVCVVNFGETHCTTETIEMRVHLSKQ